MRDRIAFRPYRCLLLVMFGFSIPNVGLTQAESVSAILTLSSGKLVVGSDRGIYLHDPDSLKREQQIVSTIEKIYSFEVSPNGKRLAVSGGAPAELGVVEIYELPGFKKMHRLEPFSDVATDVAWISNDQLVASGMTGECAVLHLNQPSARALHIHSKGVLAVEVLGKGQIASCGLDATIRVWEPTQPKNARVLNNHLDAVNGIDTRLQSDRNAIETVVSASDDGTIRFWQPVIGRMVRFVRLGANATCVIWNQDGTLAIAGCRDGTIRLIDPATAKVVGKIKRSSWIHCLALGNDRNKLFVGTENGVSSVELNKASSP